MRRRLLAHCLIMAALVAVALPASAGGMATVHLDAPPNGVVAGAPWTFGFMVMQHDVTPVNVEEATVDAQHRETGETLRATAVQEGVTGHYVAEVTFPKAGSWKWSITPAPFAGTSFESIDVLDRASAGAESAPAGHPVHIHSGSCSQLGDVRFPLSDIGPGPVVKDGAPVAATALLGTRDGETVSISEATLDVTIAELLAAPHAITIQGSAVDIGTYGGCGDISGQMWIDELVVGINQLNGSGNTGIARLIEASGKTTVTLYMLTARGDSPTVAAGPISHVEITGGQGGWQFTPGRLEIAVGTTVVWTNSTETSHTVTGTDLAFEDSGPFGSGETYSQIFADPGTYSYFCGPHPSMTGTIVVS